MMRKRIALVSPRALALIVSLCLNVLMGSYIVMQWVRDSAPAMAVTTAPPRDPRSAKTRSRAPDQGSWRATSRRAFLIESLCGTLACSNGRGMVMSFFGYLR